MDIPLLKFDSPEEDDLEPPFEIHGMTNTGNQGQLHVVEIESDDDEGEEVPPSILFEAHDTPEQSPIGLPPRQYDLSNSTRRVQHRRRSAVKINHQISSWVDVGNLDEFLTRVSSN